MRSYPVPAFYLYGEPQRLVDERFVHVEPLDDRTRPSEWTIRPHVHAHLKHIFHVARGGGTIRADGAAIAFVAPCVLLIPAGTVHGFLWDVESSGSVVTLASSYFAEFVARDADLASFFDVPTALPCESANADILSTIDRLTGELGWAAPAYRSAAEQQLLALLVTILRLRGLRTPLPAIGPQASLVARLRERIGEGFRRRESVESHAAALGVSPRRLRAACAAVVGQSPTEMQDQRTILEAKRSLLYGRLSVAEVGYALGFGDPAYFSRFFTRHVGQSPAAFRNDTSR
jgi:AraC family transcriptional activator of pobA